MLSSPSLFSKIEALDCTREFLWRSAEGVEKITIGKAFVESLKAELKSINIPQGTILLYAPEIVFDGTGGLKLFGGWDFIVVADRVNLYPNVTSGSIELVGGFGGTPQKPPWPGKEPDGARGRDGFRGGNGHHGDPGMNIKAFFVDMSNLHIRTDGGDGGIGGPGGNGGDGGDWLPADGIWHAGSGGNAGDGGNGGNGGNAGSISITYCNDAQFDIASHCYSTGGKAGTGGEPGIVGSAGAGAAPVTPGGKPGIKGTDGTPGVGTIPNIKQVSFDELWQLVANELQCS